MVMVSTSLYYYYCDYCDDYEGTIGCWHGNGMNLEAGMMMIVMIIWADHMVYGNMVWPWHCKMTSDDKFRQSTYHQKPSGQSRSRGKILSDSKSKEKSVNHKHTTKSCQIRNQNNKVSIANTQLNPVRLKITSKSKIKKLQWQTHN